MNDETPPGTLESDRALLVLGMDADHGAGIEGVGEIVRFVGGELRYFRERGRLVVFVAAGPMMSSLMPRSGELVVAAPVHGSAFAAPGLSELLRRERIRRLTLVGVETHTVVLLTAADAVARGFAVVVPETCVCAADRRSHDAALHLIRTSWSTPQQVVAPVVDDGAGVRL
jgi:hypothetical protein